MSTPYRNDIEALHERKTSLEGELQRLREQTSGLDALRARQQELVQELAEVDGRLGPNARRGLPLLDQVRVASPCNADWNAMVGDDRVRYCLSCEKNVYNLSAMQAADAEALLQERLGSEMCVRFYQRADGTLLTQDCPVGVKKKRRKKLALAVAGAGAMAAAALTAFERSHQRMGDMVVAGGMAPIPMMGEAPTSSVPYAPTETAFPTLDDSPRAAMGVRAPQPPKPALKPRMGER